MDPLKQSKLLQEALDPVETNKSAKKPAHEIENKFPNRIITRATQSEAKTVRQMKIIKITTKLCLKNLKQNKKVK